MVDLVEVWLVLRNVGQFVAGANEAAVATERIGAASKETTAATAVGAKGLIKYAGAAVGVYAVAKAAQAATSATTDLAKGTLWLQHATNMDTETASEWVSLTKERGIATTSLQMGMTTLSKVMEKSRSGTLLDAQAIGKLRSEIDQVSAAGGPKAASTIQSLSGKIATLQASSQKTQLALHQLGVPMSDLRKGNTEDVILRVADALHNMKNHATAAADAQILFGRAGRSLLPILEQGRAGVQKLLGEQPKLTPAAMAAAHKYIMAQRELGREWEKLKVEAGVALMPALTGLVHVLSGVVDVLRHLFDASWKVYTVLGLVVGTVIAFKVAATQAAIANGEATAATKLWEGAQWLLNAALDANPIGAVILLIGLLVAAIVIAVTHWKQFKAYLDFLFHGMVAGIKWVGGIAAWLGHVFVMMAEGVEHTFERLGRWLWGWAKKVWGWLNKIPGFSLAVSVAGDVGGAVSSGFSAVKGAFASGGTAWSPGPYLVGEQGPEVVMLPSGATVTPSGTPQHITIPLIVDGREIARAVANVVSNQKARQ